MTAVFFVMRFDVAPIVVWIFELPLDQEIRAVRVIRISLGFERGLVVVAIAEDRSGYVVGVKVHVSPQPHGRVQESLSRSWLIWNRGTEVLSRHTCGEQRVAGCTA